MVRCSLFGVFACLTTTVFSAAPDAAVHEISRHATKVLDKARLDNVFVRQCACWEQAECLAEMKEQLDGCTVPCFSVFKKPLMLSCVNTTEGGQVPKHDIVSIFSLAHEAASKPPSPIVQALIAPIKGYVDAFGEFAVCLKDCVLEKNKNGFCFDRKNCQPLIRSVEAGSAFRVCTRHVQWKQQAGEICECSVRAGLSDLRQYCSMFSLMAKRPRQRTN